MPEPSSGPHQHAPAGAIDAAVEEMIGLLDAAGISSPEGRAAVKQLSEDLTAAFNRSQYSKFCKYEALSLASRMFKIAAIHAGKLMSNEQVEAATGDKKAQERATRLGHAWSAGFMAQEQLDGVMDSLLEGVKAARDAEAKTKTKEPQRG